MRFRDATLFAVLLGLCTSASAQNAMGIYSLNFHGFDSYEYTWERLMNCNRTAAANWGITNRDYMTYNTLDWRIDIFVSELCEYIGTDNAMLTLCGHGAWESNIFYYVPEFNNDEAVMDLQREDLIDEGWGESELFVFHFGPAPIEYWGLGISTNSIEVRVIDQITGGFEYSDACYVFANYCRSLNQKDLWLPGLVSAGDHRGYVGWMVEDDALMFRQLICLTDVFERLYCTRKPCTPAEEALFYKPEWAVDGIMRDNERCGAVEHTNMECYIDSVNDDADYYQAGRLIPGENGCAPITTESGQ